MRETIEEAKLYLRDNFDKGVDCPCCGQKVKLYKRKVNSGMVIFLIGLYRLADKNKRKNYFRNTDVMKEMNLSATSLDYSVMKHFGLIMEMTNEDNTKKSSGYWGITSKGFSFISGQKIQKHVLIYNNKKQGFSDETTTIKDALGDKFNFDELMN